jgi:Glycine rich protein
MPLSRETSRSARSVARILAVGSLLVAGGVAAGSAEAKTDVYDEVATESIFVVPAGVHELDFVAIGGSGGDAQDGEGGAGAEVSGRLAVTPGQTLYIDVGENGEDLADGGGQVFGGGAAGGGGGGGASDIRTAPYADGLVPDPRLMVAGGGGGAGASGETAGTNGGDAETAGVDDEYPGGDPGTQIAGGLGGYGCESTGLGGNGGLGSGGEGGDSGVETGPGGGGGGGYYGGGGGGGGCHVGSSGGGGGSSLVPPLALSTLASPSASPLIEITWYPPPTIAFVAPANGATYAQGQAVNANYSCLPGEGATLQSCVGSVANGAAIDTSALGPHTFSVAAEDKSKGTTTESVTYTVVAKKSEIPPPPPVPNTVLGSHPKKVIKSKKKKVTVKFSFSSGVAGATFKCKMDKGSFTPCTSPKTYKVKRGSHTFSVEAVSAGGTDPTPATFTFKVKKKQ